MHRLSKVVLLLNFLTILFTLSAKASVPSDALIANITETECDSQSPDYVVGMEFGNCIHISYLDPVKSRRFWVAKGGQINFEFFTELSEQNRTPDSSGGPAGPKLRANYTITVTATDVSNPSNVATGSAGVTLYGSQSTAAPAGANQSGGWQQLQASPGAEAFAFVYVPVNVDWAESYVTFSVQTSQEINSVVATESCYTTAQQEKAGLQCYGYWTDSGTFQAPSLAGVNGGIVLDGVFPAANDFVLVTVPAVAAQLPVIPVAIVYAPLGNGGKAASSYTVTTSTGSTIQVGTTNTMQNSATNTTDDKISYGGTLNIASLLGLLGGAIPGAATLQYSGSQDWSTAVQTLNQNTYGTTATVASTSQIGVQYPNSDCFSSSGPPPITGPSLTSVGYATEPYWCDQIIVMIDSQFAVWDYPAGPIVQPLGNLGIDTPTIQQLDTCAKNNIPQTAQPIANNAISNSHFLVLPSATGTLYTWLSSSDCAALASLDQFYAQKTQSALPTSYVTLGNGGVNTQTGQGFNSTQTLTGTAGATGSVQQSRQVTATASSNNSFTAGEGVGESSTSPILQATFGISDTSTTSTVQSTSVTLSQQSSTVLGKQSQASTFISDTSGITVPVQVVQDSIFQGIAVRDPQMNFPAPPIIIPCTKSLCCRIGRCIPIKLEDRIKKISPTDVSTQALADYHSAAKRHFARPIPAPPKGGVMEELSPALLAHIKELNLEDPAIKALIAAKAK